MKTNAFRATIETANNLHNDVWQFSKALQAPGCHENMVEVGGYILEEYENLIAFDPRST